MAGKDKAVVILSLNEYNEMLTNQYELSSRRSRDRLDQTIFQTCAVEKVVELCSFGNRAELDLEHLEKDYQVFFTLTAPNRAIMELKFRSNSMRHPSLIYRCSFADGWVRDMVQSVL